VQFLSDGVKDVDSGAPAWADPAVTVEVAALLDDERGRLNVALQLSSRADLDEGGVQDVAENPPQDKYPCGANGAVHDACFADYEKVGRTNLTAQPAIEPGGP